MQIPNLEVWTGFLFGTLFREKMMQRHKIRTVAKRYQKPRVVVPSRKIYIRPESTNSEQDLVRDIQRKMGIGTEV